MKVVIIDDDSLVAMSLKTILEAEGDIRVAATGSSGREAIELYGKHMPDVILMDIRMEGMTGLEAGEEILKRYGNAKILFLTTFTDDEYIVQALSIGAKGYLLKQDFESIVPAVKAVCSGQSVFGGQVMGKLPDMLKKKKGIDYARYDITRQEYEIMEEVALGLSNREIAEKLCLSEGTVRNYLSNILRKLNLRDRTQLAVFYYQNR